MIIEIMARQLRILQQKIEMRSIDIKEELMKKKKTRVSTEKSPSLTGTHIAPKKRRKSTQKYKTKTSKGTASSEETGTEDMFQSDKENKSKEKIKNVSEKNKEKKQEKTEKLMDKSELLGGIIEYEEEFDEMKELVKNKATDKVVQEGQSIIEKQVIDATAEQIEGQKSEESEKVSFMHYFTLSLSMMIWKK